MRIQETRCSTIVTQFGIKMSLYEVKRSSLKIFIIATFLYLQCPITVQNFKKFLNADSENKMYMAFLAQFVIKMFQYGAKEIFEKNIHCCHLCLPDIPIHHTKM